MSEPLGWCVEAVRAAAEPGLARALLALRTRHTRRPGGAARFRERGGLGPLLELLGPERPRRTLDLALSVLGNCCTEAGCRRQARRLGGVPRLVALLSSPGPESVQNRVARTLANLALEPDGAHDILEAGAGPLLVSLAASCGTPECLHSAARALRILGAAPVPRRALGRAGAVRALASRLAALSPSHPARPSLARALRGLTEGPDHPSADDVAPALPALAALATDARRERRRPALGAIANACARARLRPALGAAGAVEAVTEEVRRGLAALDDDAAGAVRALCLLCREAVNRARVRAAGGLALLLRLLGEPRARPWRPRVLLALAAFAYDQEALAAMEARGLVPLLADVLRARAEEEKDEEEEEDEEDEEDEDEDEAAASCDLPRETPGPAGDGAAAGSWRGLKSWLLSEAASPPPSPPAKCPSPSAAPPARRRLPPMGALALPRGVGEGDPWLPETPALLLLGRLASADEPSRALATAPVVSGLLRYLTGVPSPAPRALRLLQRLMGHPAFLGALIRAYIPSLLHSWLVLGLPPPQAEELSRPGTPRWTSGAPHPRQACLQELGEGLLRNLGAAAAAPFGVGLLTHMLRCGTPPARLACATALPLLARPASPARALLWGGGAVALLLSAVARGHPSTYEPPPAFALYAADAIAVLRGHAGDTGNVPEQPINGHPNGAQDAQVPGDADAKDLWGHGDDTQDWWGHGDTEDLGGQRDMRGSSDDAPGGDGDLRRLPEPCKDPWGHGDTGGQAGGSGGDAWGQANGLGDLSPCALSPVSLLPPPLLSPVSPSPQALPEPPSPGPACPQVSPTFSNPCPRVSSRATKRPWLSPDPPQVAPRPPKSPRLPDPCPPLSPGSPNPCPQLSPPPQVPPASPNRCHHACPASSNPPSPHPHPSPSVPEPRPRASPTCPYARSPHDLLLLPDGVPPGVPVTRGALTRGSPVLGAMLGGAFTEARQAAVTLARAPRRPLLLLLHFIHGCRGGHGGEGCPLLSPPVPAATAGAAIALARRYLVEGFEDVAATAVAASPGVLWALAERWGCVPLAVRAARAILGGPPEKVAPRLARVARLTRCPRRLARALMAAVAPWGAQPHLEMGEPWGQGDPLVAPRGDVQEDLEAAFGVPYEELGDLGDVGDLFEEPPMAGGDPLGEDGDEVEIKGTL